MQTVGNITSYIDLAQLLLYVFWIFFAGLIYYLVQENHREGYPMESSSSGRAVVKGWPIPEPKTFKLENGKSVTVPDLARKEPPYSGRSTGYGSGAPLEPTGDPMKAAIGAGAYSMREDVPEMAATVLADDLDATHAVRVVFARPHVVVEHGAREARPAGARIELVVRVKELCSAASTGVDARRMVIDVGAGKRRLGSLLAQHGVLLRRQQLAPFLVCAFHAHDFLRQFDRS